MPCVGKLQSIFFDQLVHIFVCALLFSVVLGMESDSGASDGLWSFDESC